MRRTILAAVAGLLTLAQAPASAQPVLTLRDRLVVVSSASSAGLAQLLVRNFTDRYEGVPQPITNAVGSARALELFCSGSGPQTPDIAIVTRRMPRAMQDACAANGVRDIVELQIGLGAVVLVARRGEAMPGLTSRQLWEAVAAERPEEDEFLPNATRFWSDIANTLPRHDIRVIVPQLGAGTRALFDDLILESGCRYVKAVRLLFEASYRRGKCVSVRQDGRVVAVPSDAVPAALLAAPAGTLAVMSYDQVIASGGNFVPVMLDGTMPSAASIGGHDYDPTRTFYLYAKRQHGRNQQGVGVVRGIREFLNETVSEQAGGPGGYLTSAGLVPLGPAERAAQRRIAETQSLMSR